MKISDIREAIDALNWNRIDATGGTVEENKRTPLPRILEPHIERVRQLEIPARFARDIERRASALESATKVCTSWHDNNGIAVFHAQETILQ